ncbi:MAG: pyrroline-5-carboxylate reductase [Acidimicrobiales bacterium]|nr:pyrroline-5-carboxylate reductase [Acidimicrobiales bacterium]
MTRLQIIGGGKMGEALLGGLIANGWAPATDLAVIEPDDARRVAVATANSGVSTAAEPVANVDAIVAVKPAIVPVVLDQLAAIGIGRVLSIAAGVTIATLEAHAGADAVVVRAMPNTPAMIGAGAAAIAPGSNAGSRDVEWAAEILSAVGEVVTVDEADLDAVTGLSGSGPAYVFLLAEALAAAGIAQGLEPTVADRLARQTIFGAGALLAESDESAEQLRINVTSPNGTTAAGLAVFEQADFRALVADVVAAATARSVELGRA